MIAILRAPAATYLMQILASAFLAILFLQSGIDKILDRRGNFEWLKGHFGKSPLAAIVTALLICITILEVAAGALIEQADCQLTRFLKAGDGLVDDNVLLVLELLLRHLRPG